MLSRIGWLGAVTALCLLAVPTQAGPILPRLNLLRTEQRLCGSIVDFTRHHGVDRRIWSDALGEKRDLYVYLPPGYDPKRSYPVMLWLHGFMQDESAFVQVFAEPFDKAIACGKLPPMIIAAPDGSIKGRPSFFGGNSFFINSDAGAYEDYLIDDVWPFLLSHFSIRPEREAHVLAGMSMGGFASFNHAIKHRDMFKIAAGIYPPLNLRWLDCHGRYMANFDPACWAWRENVDRGFEVVGRFGPVLIPLMVMIDPLFKRGPDTAARLSAENPIELLDFYDVQEGDLDLYVAYGGKDEFNLDAQIEGFLFVARQRGITVSVDYKRRGRHNIGTALRFVPCMIDWLAERLAGYHEAPVSE